MHQFHIPVMGTGFSIDTPFPKNRKVLVLALVYAFYVGLSVSVSIHWLPEFVAGTIIGSVVGKVVGNGYSANLSSQ